jgi:small subunit ribosomal protein S7
MSRGKSKTKKRLVELDPKYQSLIITKLINYIMMGGKKSIAQEVVYSALEKLEKMTKAPALDSFNRAIENVMPQVEVKSRRVGGANYQVPVEINERRRQTLALRWIIGFARARKGQPMAEKLAQELMDAYKNQGSAIKKKEDTHKMAEANRAFAHYARM